MTWEFLTISSADNHKFLETVRTISNGKMTLGTRIKNESAKSKCGDLITNSLKQNHIILVNEGFKIDISVWNFS